MQSLMIGRLVQYGWQSMALSIHYDANEQMNDCKKTLSNLGHFISITNLVIALLQELNCIPGNITLCDSFGLK